METKQHTESQRLFLEEVELHTIKILPTDTIDDKLDKIAVNLNGKTEAIAKLRRGVTRVEAELTKMPTMEQFASVTAIVEDHKKRFERFDLWCVDSLEFIKKVWGEIKDIGYQGIKKAVILFICIIVLYVLYAIAAKEMPWLKLEKPVPSPSS